MNESQKELEKIVETYYQDLVSQDTSVIDNYQFSDRYLDRKQELLSKMALKKKIHSHSLRRKIIIALIAAALIGTITVAAYEPARKFFMKIFTGYTEITPAENNSGVDSHKTVIEKKYSITVPDGYVLDETNSVDTDEMVLHKYLNQNKELVFTQEVKSVFKLYIDNEHTNLASKTDKDGQEILVHNIDDVSVILIWDNGEYIFELSGEMSETELMEIYYTVK